MSSQTFQKLIAAILADEASFHERRQHEHLMIASEKYKRLYELHAYIWNETRLEYSSDDTEAVFNNILRQISKNDHAEEISEYELVMRKQRKLIRNILAIAAAISILIIAVFVMMPLKQNTRPEAAEPMIKMFERNMNKGEKVRFFLTDGTKIWLNSESSLQYPDKFPENNRLVRLTGEAYFEVEQDLSKPFVVQTDFLDVIAVGTSFNVASYSEEEDTRILLRSGKVIVKYHSDRNNDIVLEPGQQITFRNRTGEFVIEEVDMEPVLAWKDGILIFKDAGFYEVINKLSRWYGVEFEIQNYDGQKWMYTGRFENEYLSTLLESMSYSKGFDYQIVDKKVYIKF